MLPLVNEKKDGQKICIAYSALRKLVSFPHLCNIWLVSLLFLSHFQPFLSLFSTTIRSFSAFSDQSARSFLYINTHNIIHLKAALRFSVTASSWWVHFHSLPPFSFYYGPWWFMLNNHVSRLNNQSYKTMNISHANFLNHSWLYTIHRFNLLSKHESSHRFKQSLFIHHSHHLEICGLLGIYRWHGYQHDWTTTWQSPNT